MSHMGINIGEEKKKVEIKHVENFDPEKNGSGVLLVRRNNEKVVRHRKGDAEVILAMCSNYITLETGRLETLMRTQESS